MVPCVVASAGAGTEGMVLLAAFHSVHMHMLSSVLYVPIPLYINTEEICVRCIVLFGFSLVMGFYWIGHTDHKPAGSSFTSAS